MNEIFISNLSSGEKIVEFEGHRSSISCVRFSPCGSLLATGSYDKTIKLWDCESWTAVQTLFGHEKYVIELSFNARSDRIVSTSRDRTVRVWSLVTYHG